MNEKLYKFFNMDNMLYIVMMSMISLKRDFKTILNSYAITGLQNELAIHPTVLHGIGALFRLSFSDPGLKILKCLNA